MSGKLWKHFCRRWCVAEERRPASLSSLSKRLSADGNTSVGTEHCPGSEGRHLVMAALIESSWHDWRLRSAGHPFSSPIWHVWHFVIQRGRGWWIIPWMSRGILRGNGGVGEGGRLIVLLRYLPGLVAFRCDFEAKYHVDWKIQCIREEEDLHWSEGGEMCKVFGLFCHFWLFFFFY